MILLDTTSRRSGQAMVICLTVIGFLTAILGATSMMLLTHSRLASYEQQRLIAFYLARSGLEAGNLLLVEDDRSVDALSDVWNNRTEDAGGELTNGRFGLGRWPQEETEGPGPIVDEERKLNVNSATAEMLQALSPAFDAEVVRAIHQRRDKQPFRHLTELYATSGLGREELQRASASGSSLPLHALLTVHGSGRLNVNTAPLAALRCIPGLDEDSAEKLVDERRGEDGQPGTEDDRPFNRIEQVRERLQVSEDSWQKMNGWLTVSSTHFTVRGWGRTKKEPAARVNLQQVLRREAGRLIVVEFIQDGHIRD